MDIKMNCWRICEEIQKLIFKWILKGHVKGIIQEFFFKNQRCNTNFVFKWILKAPGQALHGEFLMNFFWKTWKRIQLADFKLNFRRTWDGIHMWIFEWIFEGPENGFKCGCWNEFFEGFVKGFKSGFLSKFWKHLEGIYTGIF